MRRIDVLKYKYAAIGVSSAFIVIGIVFFIVFGGFNTGIDFGSGFSERVQVAPLGFKASYSGQKSAVLSVSSNTLVLQLRDANGVEIHQYPESDYPTAGDVAKALSDSGISVEVKDPSLRTGNLVSGFGFPAVLTSSPFNVNFATDSKDVTIEDIREALKAVGSVNVQTVGTQSDGIFQVRLSVEDGETQSEIEAKVNAALRSAFGNDSLVVMQSDFVGPKFSSALLLNSIKAVLIAIALVLVYIAIRFRLSYALSSIIALFHDVLAMLSFILIFRLEVSSTTIAAVLTIIGYSLNNTIVIFDRVRENIKLNKKHDVCDIINRSIEQSLSRTVITSLTTLFAIVPLAIFGSGDIKLFAINLTWGVVIGAYSSNFLAPAMLSFFHKLWPINVEKEKNEDYSLV
ncbi:MAG: protein translocase subunit SecF [Candidatus Ornithospirochaeta sp.]|nr:protein translocase subunit SecF [Candidatus Ornithospirochaeta sp.]